jgi:hypothetical protein
MMLQRGTEIEDVGTYFEQELDYLVTRDEYRNNRLR